MGSTCLPPLHPLLQTSSPWAYLQQLMQLHAAITRPGTSDAWEVQVQGGFVSVDGHLRLCTGASTLDICFGDKVQASCPLLAGEGNDFEAMTGPREFLSAHWSPDSSRCALTHFECWPDPPQATCSVVLHMLEIAPAEQLQLAQPCQAGLTRLPPVQLHTHSGVDAEVHAAWSPCSAMLAVAFCASDESGTSAHILWICGRQGTIKARIDFEHPRWSDWAWAPDSSALVAATPLSLLNWDLLHVVYPEGQHDLATIDLRLDPPNAGGFTLAVWAPQTRDCTSLLLVLIDKHLCCFDSDTGAMVPSDGAGDLSSLGLTTFVSEPYHLACGLEHVAVVLTCHVVQLHKMQPGPSLQLVANVQADVGSSHLCFHPTGSYFALIDANNRLLVVGTGHGNVLTSQSLADAGDNVFFVHPIWHSGLHMLTASGSRAETREQVHVHFV